MKFLADENFPALCVEKLRRAGLDVKCTSDFLTQVICSRQDWYLHFSVIENDKIRIR